VTRARILLRPFFPGTNRAWVAYYDATAGDLRLAHYTGPDAEGNNCGPDNAWVCETVPDPDRDTNDLGKHNAIAIHKNSLLLGTWKVGITYQDTTSGSLKLAEYSCSPFPLPGGCSWSFTRIHLGSVAFKAGFYTSLVYGSNGKAHIAHYVSSLLSIDSVHYVYPVSSGGNCGEGSAAGKWQCDLIESGEGMGRFVSLDLSLTDEPYLSYYDGDGKDLKYAWAIDGGNCGPGGNTWRCIVIDSDGDVGKYPSLFLPRAAGETARIAYYDVTNKKLKLAYIDNDNSNCGGPFPWRCITLDDMGDDPGVRSISLSAHQNTPLIAYRSKPADPSQGELKIAHPQFLGNCGPSVSIPPVTIKSWRCTTLDTGLRVQGGFPPTFSFHDVGRYPSVVLNSSGLATISYYDATSGDLRITYQLMQLYNPLSMRAP
jgi:hypothetical protein